MEDSPFLGWCYSTVYALNCLLPFIYWWTPPWTPYLRYYEQCCHKHRTADDLFAIVASCLWKYEHTEITRSYYIFCAFWYLISLRQNQRFIENMEVVVGIHRRWDGIYATSIQHISWQTISNSWMSEWMNE